MTSNKTPNKRYTDEYGEIWIYLIKCGKPCLFNPFLGYGLWDNGRGLTLIK